MYYLSSHRFRRATLLSGLQEQRSLKAGVPNFADHAGTWWLCREGSRQPYKMVVGGKYFYTSRYKYVRNPTVTVSKGINVNESEWDKGK